MVEYSPPAPFTPVRVVDSQFTVRYDPDASFNPITGTSPNNMALTPLLYEGLFVLNERFEAEPVLCQSFTMDDGLSYAFTIKSDVLFSDGSALTSRDVKYSLEQARQTGRFTGRLERIEDIETPDEHTVVITLSAPHGRLPVLLDVPVIKYGTISAACPPGTGPYALDTSGEAPCLVASPLYRDTASAPVDVIYLGACSDAELPARFLAQEIDLFWSDPGGINTLRLTQDHDAWYYNTSILQYVGFNMKRDYLSHTAFRRAISLAVNRAEIVEEVLGGHAVAAPLVLSPKYPLYDAAWARPVRDVSSEISAIFAEIGLEDFNSDGYLEYPGAGGSQPFTLSLLVHDQPFKVAAAEKITDALMSIGINVELVKRPWEQYLSALQKGQFDLYLADVCLPADFDLSALLAPGGALDYGRAGSDAYRDYIAAFLAARGKENETLAARQLCATIEENAPIIPVLYRQYAVHLSRNTARGLSPTQSSIFYNLSNWTITLGPSG
jgi:peptide/nickel transport system substrate-binding protein